MIVGVGAYVAGNKITSVHSAGLIDQYVPAFIVLCRGVLSALKFIIYKYSIAFFHDSIELPHLLGFVRLRPPNRIIKPKDDKAIFALLLC